jgi:hypothetical protein
MLKVFSIPTYLYSKGYNPILKSLLEKYPDPESLECKETQMVVMVPKNVETLESGDFTVEWELRIVPKEVLKDVKFTEEDVIEVRDFQPDT